MTAHTCHSRYAWNCVLSDCHWRVLRKNGAQMRTKRNAHGQALGIGRNGQVLLLIPEGAINKYKAIIVSARRVILYGIFWRSEILASAWVRDV